MRMYRKQEKYLGKQYHPMTESTVRRGIGIRGSRIVLWNEPYLQSSHPVLHDTQSTPGFALQTNMMII